ncbi:glycosyltransferase [Faecalibacillus intestinalis]|uniref:Glycosyltransferase n=1 Tax=Faecalibacillus intestinalis TaxID=1982626 RepID=A0AAW4VIF1_9FIRM|nr:glycosyltransferase [Faecalibacillus intestinalis]MCB8561254.1 glycosyltransferase [Faecalibacillus intestinalis]MCG4809511.1 glycosyltransferase [Faecalibacillus intestinalis]MEE1447904.1 glycosyltransferase [Faecalibacillus intestinalis]
MAKIGLLITKLNGGGAERTAANLSSLFDEYGEEVYLITFDGSNITYPYKGKLIDLSLGINKNVFDAIKKNIKRIIKVKKIKKKYNLDVCISFLDTPNLVNVLSGGKCKKIVSIRNYLSLEKPSFIRKQLIRFSSIRADKTVCISKNVEYDMRDFFKIKEKKLCTIYNPVDIKSLLTIEEDYTFDKEFSDYFNIVTMGRLTYQKGQWNLIYAIKDIVVQYPKVRLYILGDGELKNELEELVKKLELEEHVFFLGFISNAHKFLRQCDLFVLTSLFEGLGNVLLEAMALGLPVISTDCKSGPREIIAPNSNIKSVCENIDVERFGILVKQFSKEKNIVDNDSLVYIKQAIEMFYLDKKLREKYTTKSKMRANDFSKEKVYNEWMKLL